MAQMLNPYAFDTPSPLESLDNWMSPSALQDPDPESASYWGLPNGNLDSTFASSHKDQLQHYTSDNQTLTSRTSISPYTGSQSVQTDIVVSPVFPPITGGGKRLSTDLILLTADFTLFYVDEATLLKVSDNSFNGFLPVHTHSNGRRVVYLSKLFSAELEVMLKVIYDVPEISQAIWQSRSDVQNIINSISILTQYGVYPKVCVHSRSHMFKYLLTCAALYPLDVYALAAQYDMHELAMAASSHLLSVNLKTIDSAAAMRIGPVYLKRLFDMLEQRKLFLSNLLAVEPGLHNTTKKCGFSDQRMLKLKWNLGVSFLMCNMNASITTITIRDTLVKATSEIKCRDCIKTRDERVRMVCREWSVAPRTI